MLVKFFGVNWKSTVAGILSFLLVTFGSLTSWLATLPSTTHTPAWIALSISLLTGLCRVWVAFITNDAQNPPPPPTT